MVDIIVYGYDLAPNPQKLVQFLAFFNIPYKFYEVSTTLPRPELASVGVEYRRTPLLSIDSDMYVDNALIIEKLADIAAHSQPDVDTTNYREFDGFGQGIFRLATSLFPITLPLFKSKEFLDDRIDLLGYNKFDPVALTQARPQLLSEMMSYIALIESQYLSNGKQYIKGGEKPTTADLYVYWALNAGLVQHLGARPEISESTHPVIFAWLARIKAFLQERQRVEKVTWDEAKEILVRPPKHEYAKFVPHDAANVLGLKEGQEITVTPTDTGRTHPQHGTLISLNSRQVCLRNRKGLVMHFPRINYIVAAA